MTSSMQSICTLLSMSWSGETTAGSKEEKERTFLSKGMMSVHHAENQEREGLQQVIIMTIPAGGLTIDLGGKLT